MFFGFYMGAMVAGFNVFRISYTKVCRTYTGWEDPETNEFQQKNIKKFQANNEDAEIIKLVPNPEDCF